MLGALKDFCEVAQKKQSLKYCVLPHFCNVLLRTVYGYVCTYICVQICEFVYEYMSLEKSMKGHILGCYLGEEAGRKVM